jgi:cob(I)alamin adenosyltransferase
VLPGKIKALLPATGRLREPFHIVFRNHTTMDKKAKKRLEIIRKTLQKLRLQLSGARQQDDEPGEVQRLESNIAELEQEAEKLKNS